MTSHDYLLIPLLTYGVDDEQDMRLNGFIRFLDPALPAAQPSIMALHKLNVEVKVMTGDNEIVIKKICEDVCIPVKKITLGHELEMLTDEELTEQVSEISRLIKLSPL